MKIKELRGKSEKELKKLLQETREKLRDCRFRVAQKQFKNVRELRNLKKTIGRILTLMNS